MTNKPSARKSEVNRVSFSARVKPSTLEKIKAMAEKLNISQGEYIDLLNEKDSNEL